MLFYGKFHDDPLTSVIDATSNLWRNVDIRPGGFPGDLDPVWEGGGGGLGPAAPAVLGNVLVLGLSQEVLTSNVSPEPLRGRGVSSPGTFYQGWSGGAFRPGLVAMVVAQTVAERNHEGKV